MPGFSLQPMPRSTSVMVLHADYRRAPVALVVGNRAGGVTLIPVETGNPPPPLTGEPVRFPHLGAVASHLGVAWGVLAA